MAYRARRTVFGQERTVVVTYNENLLDPHGRAAEWSGFYGAKDGQVVITADLATNDTPGLWRITAREGWRAMRTWRWGGKGSTGIAQAIRRRRLAAGGCQHRQYVVFLVMIGEPLA